MLSFPGEAMLAFKTGFTVRTILIRHMRICVMGATPMITRISEINFHF